MDVAFEARYRNVPAGCAVRHEDGTELTDLRFFVTEPALHETDGDWVEVVATRQATLIDLEDGSGGCRNGTPGVTRTLSLIAPRGDYDGLSFTVGVPFALNHADPIHAAPPLNDPAMHWHWRTGYKFLRLGLERGGVRWHVHIGSTGCSGPVGAVSGCSRGNRARISLRDWAPGRPVIVDIERLIDGLDIEAGPDHCLGDPESESCRRVLAGLGIDPASGVAGSSSVAFAVGTVGP